MPRYQPRWERRRIVVFGTLAFCAVAVAYLIGWGDDTALHREIATALILLAASVVGSYVFGAAWDDRNVMAYGGQQADPAGEGQAG